MARRGAQLLVAELLRRETTSCSFDTARRPSPALLLGFLAPASSSASPSSLPQQPTSRRRERHDAAGEPQRRTLTSASATAASPSPPQPATLKAALRLLYMRVHPDVMGAARAAERDRNERSLKLLSEYLAAARCATGGGGGGDGDDDDDAAFLRAAPPSTHTLPFRFVFYVPPSPEEEEQGAREDDDDDDDDDEVDDAPPPALRKVELTLPPPERGRGRRGTLSPPARRALRRLLVACGVPEPPLDAPDDERRQRRGEDAGDDNDGRGANDIPGLDPGQGLADWLPLAAEAARRGGGGGVFGGPTTTGGGSSHHPAPATDWAVRVANLRGALRLSRGAAVGFSPELRRALPAGRQAALLAALIGVLEREDAAALAEVEDQEEEDAQLDLRGLQLTFFSGGGGLGGGGGGGGGGGSSGLDGAGTVWLDASEAGAIEASVRHGEWREAQQRKRPGAAATAPQRPPATPAQLTAAEDATEAWADLLSGLDPGHARALRAAAEALRALEASVARAMGVSAVVAGAGVAFGGGGGGGASGGGVNPSYRAFLERLAAHASSAGPVQAPVSDVPLVVVGGDGGREKEEATSTSSSSSDAVTVLITAAPPETYALLASRGPAAAERRRRAQRERADRADRDERARRALGLRRLLRDPALPADRADRGVRALLRLRDRAGPSLAACLEGLSVRVSDACRMPGTQGTDGSSDVVDVAWQGGG